MTHGERITSALALIPQGEFLLTAAKGRRSNGVILDFVGQCANNPPMLVVATAKGQVLTPIIRDSRAFVVSLITDSTRPLARRFARSNVEAEDPFIGLPTDTTPRGSRSWPERWRGLNANWSVISTSMPTASSTSATSPR